LKSSFSFIISSRYFWFVVSGKLLIPYNNQLKCDSFFSTFNFFNVAGSVE
jgi:hypothetical protein